MTSPFINKQQSQHKNIFPGVDIFTAAGKEMMLSFVELKKGAEVELHSHPNEQVGCLLKGQLHFFVGDAEQILHPGDMWIIPADVPHKVIALEDSEALDIFHPIRTDYL